MEGIRSDYDAELARGIEESRIDTGLARSRQTSKERRERQRRHLNLSRPAPAPAPAPPRAPAEPPPPRVWSETMPGPIPPSLQWRPRIRTPWPTPRIEEETGKDLYQVPEEPSMEGPEIVVSESPISPEADIGFSNPWVSHGFGPKQSHDRVIRLFKDIQGVISRGLSYEELNLSRNFPEYGPEQKKILEQTIVVGLAVLLCFGFQFIDYLLITFKKDPSLLDSFGYNNHSVQLWGITPGMTQISGDLRNTDYRTVLLQGLEDSIKLLREGTLENSFSIEDQLISSTLSNGAVASFENRFRELLLVKPSADATPLVSLIRLLEIPRKVNDIADLLWTISISYREKEHIHLFQGVSILITFLSDINSTDQLRIWREYEKYLGETEPRPHYRKSQDRQLQLEKLKHAEEHVKKHGTEGITEEQKRTLQSKRYSVFQTDEAKWPAHDQRPIPESSVTDLLKPKQRKDLYRELGEIGIDEPEEDYTGEALPPGEWYKYQPDKKIDLAYDKQIGRIIEHPDKSKIEGTYEEADVPMQHLDDLEDLQSKRKGKVTKKRGPKKKATKKKGPKPKPKIQKKKKDKKKASKTPVKARSKGKKKKPKKPKKKKDRTFTLKIKYN